MPEITILPSGHVFAAEGNETMLESALRAGLAPNYGCSNGNCGQCKAHCVEGQIERIRYHDYALTEAEKNAGYFLLCANRALSDAVIETDEATGVQAIPRQRIDAKLKKITLPHQDIALLHLQTPRTRRLRFLAGQEARLILADPVAPAAKTLPIASCPCDDRNLQFHLLRSENDAFTRRIFDKMPIGTTITIDGPGGDFVFDEDIDLPVVFFARDAGFASVKSLIEHALAIGFTQPIYLFWLASIDDGHYMVNLLRAWQDAFENFFYCPSMLNQIVHPENPEMMAKFLNRQMLDGYKFNNFYTYAAGDKSFINAVEMALQQRQLPSHQRLLQLTT